MSDSQNTAGGNAQRNAQQNTGAEGQRGNEESGEEAAAWFATTAVRAGLTLIGLVLLLFALGQAVGIPLLDMATDALTTQTGQWLVVAFFALLLIGAAQKVATAT